tara:strand:+ start:186 stop:413 length:228 start_codon:yes stop_codon:yes gene_type:complete
MALTRQERRERRRNIIKKAIECAEAIFPEDEEARRDWVAALIAAQLDIPGLGEAAEKRLFSIMIDLIFDILDGDE